jgi:hypothetical protein
MPPMFHRQSSDNSPAPIVDAEVVEELDGPAGDADVVEQPDGPAADAETTESVPVLAEVRTLAAPAPVMLPAVQAAAVAATGFVAGAATVALVRRHGARKLARSRSPRRALDALPIVGSRSFLVDVHLIARDAGGNQ